MSAAVGERWICEHCGRICRGAVACSGCGQWPQAVPLPPTADGDLAADSGSEGAESEPKLNPAEPGHARREVCPQCAQPGLLDLDGSLAQCEFCGELRWQGAEPRLALAGLRQAEAPAESGRTKRGRARSDKRRGLSAGAAWSLGLFSLLFAGAVVAVVLVQRARDEKGVARFDAQAQYRNEIVRKVPWLGDATLTQEVQQVAIAYVSASATEEFVPLIINGAALRELVRAWMGTRVIEPLSVTDLDLVAAEVKQLEGEFWLLPMQTRDKPETRRELIVQVRRQFCRVDWQGTEGLGDYLWDSWLLGRPQEPATMRLLVRASRSRVPGFDPERSRQVLMRAEGSNQGGVLALVERGSALDQRLTELGVSNVESERAELALSPEAENRLPSVKLTVRAHFPAQRQTLPGGVEVVMLDEVVRGDWLSLASLQKPDDGEEEGMEPQE